MSELRITAVSPDRQHLTEIARVAQKTGSRITAVNGSLLDMGTISGLAADVLIVDCDGDNIAELAPLERLSGQHPNMALVVLCKLQSPEFLIQAMRAGVREVLQSPVRELELQAAIERISAKAADPTATRKGKILAFASCKGGSGATFLASNLAYTLAAQGEQKVALFDMNLQFGDALLFLTEQKVKTSLSDVVRDIHRLDAAFLASSMSAVESNLSVLPAPEDPAHGMEVTADHIDALLKLARSQYDYVILDIGRSLDAPTIRALDHADTIYTVLQNNLPFVRAAKRMLDIFRTLEYPANKVSLIVNRFEKDGELGLKDVQSTLGTRVRRAIPNHYAAAAASVNQGIPVCKLARSSPLSRSLMEWGEELHGKPATESGSWITRILKRA